MTRVRRALAVAVLWAAGCNLHALAHLIQWATTDRDRPTAASSLRLPVETVTQQLRTIEVLMQRIGRP